MHLGLDGMGYRVAAELDAIPTLSFPPRRIQLLHQNGSHRVAERVALVIEDKGPRRLHSHSLPISHPLSRPTSSTL